MKSTTSIKRLVFGAALGIATLGLVACDTLSKQSTEVPLDATAVLTQANQAMGTGSVNSLSFVASGTGAFHGQAFTPNYAWPKLTYRTFNRHMDYAGSAMRDDLARSRAEPNGGGGLPLMGEGEQRMISVVQNNLAWNMVGPAQVASPASVFSRVHDLWTSPHGVLKAAAKNRASAIKVMEGEKSYRVLRFTEPGFFLASAYVNEQGFVEKVVSRIPHPVLGESELTTHYGAYSTQGGVSFPRSIRQLQDGTTVLDLQVSEVSLNAGQAIAAGDNVKTFAERAVAELAAPGVWYIAGGSHHSVAIEMNDHIILVESPLYDARAEAAMNEARRVIPNKPIRTMVNSHHHFDHAGGVRAAAAQGATIVVSSLGHGFFQKALSTPSTIAPDALARSGKKAQLETVNGKRVFSDSLRSVEVHEIRDSIHAQGYLMVYLPKERLLIQADSFTPPAPNTPVPDKPNVTHLSLIDNIEKLGLNVERLLPLHGRIVPVTELYRLAGKAK